MKKQRKIGTLVCGLFCLAGATAHSGAFWREAPKGVPGAVSVTSTESGKTTFECIGYADLETQRRMTPDTVFWMASNTKGVAAATALAVVGEGKLLLDDPVEKYFPSWKKLAAKKRPTLRMLLSHTAGLPFFTDRPLPGPGMAALAERAAEQPLAYEPGTKYQYSNWGIDVAMAVVEKATGRPFDVEMRERIFKPLGMADTTFVPSGAQRARAATVYRLFELKDPEPETVERGLAAPYLAYGEIPEAGGGLLSTPRDMIRFFRMIADGGKAPDGTVVIPAGLMKAWTANQVPAKLGSSYSFGMGVERKGVIAHGGQAGTFGEADTTRRRARLLMVNLEGKNPDYEAFRKNWMQVTDLRSKWFWYSSEYLGLDRTPAERKALTQQLWRHDVAAETKLWPEGKVPFRKNDRPLRFLEHELWQRNLVVSDVNDPFFVFYPASEKGEGRRPVVVVLPGGGYSVLGWNKEGTEVAAWLNANGISAAVLLYRAPDQRKAALCDVQRTIGLLRRDAEKYGVDPKKVGVIGFSAGANLAVAASTNWRKRAYERVDEADDLSCRPDFQLPIYLWDVLERDGNPEDIAPLLDNGREPAVRAEYPVDAETPPAFLAQAKDDFCQIETTVFYHRALRAAGVKNCEMHLMDHGGHGYGLRRVGNPTDDWSDRAAAWLAQIVGNPSLDVRQARTGGTVSKDALKTVLVSKNGSHILRLEKRQKGDLALEIEYAVDFPPTVGPLVWHHDMRTSRTVADGDGILRNASRQTDVGSGWLSYWPFAAVTGKDGKGTALALDPDYPAFYHFQLDAKTRRLVLHLDIALADESPTAEVRFVEYPIEGKSPFRCALKHYYERYPKAFVSRVKDHGVWMPFAKISEVRNWEDFGFKFKEGDNETAWDRAHGIYTFTYTEPTTWWQDMPGPTNSYDLAKAGECALKSPGGYARAWRDGVFHDRDGQPVGFIKDTPWCKGVVWNLNDAPGIAGETGWKAKMNHPPRCEYVDSAEMYVTVPMDFRRSHFGGMKTPLCWDARTGRPAVFKGLIGYEYVRAAAEKSHAAGFLTMANGTPMEWFWLAPNLDVLGTEWDWQDWRDGKRVWTPPSDTELIYRRALCGKKPFCFLMNTDFAIFTPERAKKYFDRCLAYGAFPGFFSIDAATAQYFTRPELYERERPLYKKYLPLIKTISECGWSPDNTLLEASDPRVISEQFGEKYVTLFNPLDRALEVKIRFAGDPVREMLSNESVARPREWTTLTLEPESARIYSVF